MEIEIWKDIKGYDGKYQVSNWGRVKSFIKHNGTTERVLKLKPRNGYLMCALRKNKKSHAMNAHRLIAMAFIPNPENKPQVNHKNGIKTDNRVENLEWCTSKENINHSWINGMSAVAYGEKHPNSKLTEKDVLEIREKYRPFKYTQKMLAGEYGVTFSLIRKIIQRKSWKHI